MKLTCHGAKARALKLVKTLFKGVHVRFNTVFSGLVERWVRRAHFYLSHTEHIKFYAGLAYIGRAATKEQIKKLISELPKYKQKPAWLFMLAICDFSDEYETKFKSKQR